VSQHSAAIAGTLLGNFDRASISELTPQVWEIMQTVREAKQNQALTSLDEAVSAQKFVSTLGEAWRLAQEGRGKLLVVEKSYHEPAILSPNGGIELVAEPGGTEIIDDAVDEIIEAVLANGGEVALVEDGTLAQHQRIALVLRY
jgi:hypothetical protein